MRTKLLMVALAVVLLSHGVTGQLELATRAEDTFDVLAAGVNLALAGFLLGILTEQRYGR